jgi:hypothetical protein
VPAHPVGYDVQTVVGEDRKVVLVVGALAADVCLARYLDAEGS